MIKKCDDEEKEKAKAKMAEQKPDLVILKKEMTDVANQGEVQVQKRMRERKKSTESDIH